MNDWMSQAACLGRPEVFEVDKRRGPTQVRIALAICHTQCPVLDHCREWAAGHRWAAIVVGGVVYSQAGRRWATTFRPGSADALGRSPPRRQATDPHPTHMKEKP